MQISLNRPELEKFVAEQVQSGTFSSPSAVIEAALSRMMLEEDLYESDEETDAAIDRAEAQTARGEGRPWEDVRRELEVKYLKK
jgi:putative addiction module CopG family antidote